MNKYIVKLSYTDRPLTHCMLHGNCVFRHKCWWWWGSTDGNWELHRQIKTTNFRHGWASRAERICNLPNQSEQSCSALGCVEMAQAAHRCMHDQIHASPNHTQWRQCWWCRDLGMPQNIRLKQSKDTRISFCFPLPLSTNCVYVRGGGCVHVCSHIYYILTTKILIIPAKWDHVYKVRPLDSGLGKG